MKKLCEEGLPKVIICSILYIIFKKDGAVVTLESWKLTRIKLLDGKWCILRHT